MSGLVVFAVDHPHPDPRHVMRTYRKHILATKKKFGSARALMHYLQFVQTYLHCKRIYLHGRRTESQKG